MMRLNVRIAVPAILLGALVLTVGCKGGSSSGSASGSSSTKSVSITAADRKEAHELFTLRCAACHGQFGRGDGPGAAGLNPKPRNYADAVWQKTVTDEEIEKAIVYGGAAVGKSLQMVANPDLQAKPGVVAALREKVRKFGEQ